MAATKAPRALPATDRVGDAASHGSDSQILVGMTQPSLSRANAVARAFDSTGSVGKTKDLRISDSDHGGRLYLRRR